MRDAYVEKQVKVFNYIFFIFQAVTHLSKLHYPMYLAGLDYICAGP